jgi:hypothetical protein
MLVMVLVFRMFFFSYNLSFVETINNDMGI